MRGWPLVFGIIGGAAALAFALKALPVGIVIVLAMGAVAFASVRLRKLSVSSKDGVAAQTLGFQRSPTDPFALLSLPLSLFARGSDPVVADVLWGTWGGREVKLFSLGFTDLTGLGRTFACVLAPSPVLSTPIVVEPRTFLVPTAGPGSLPVVRIDDDAFASAFEVRAEDADRAASVLGATLRGELLARGERWGLEVRDRMLVCSSPAEGMDPIESLETMTALHRALDPGAAAKGVGPSEQAGPSPA